MCTLFVFRATINFFTHTSLLRANAEFCETLLRTSKKYALKYCCSSTLSRTKCFLKWCNIDVLYFYPLRVFCDILCCLEVADDITAERYRIEWKMFLSILQSLYEYSGKRNYSLLDFSLLIRNSIRMTQIWHKFSEN